MTAARMSHPAASDRLCAVYRAPMRLTLSEHAVAHIGQGFVIQRLQDFEPERIGTMSGPRRLQPTPAVAALAQGEPGPVLDLVEVRRRANPAPAGGGAGDGEDAALGLALL